jgi:hypothetical protein
MSEPNGDTAGVDHLDIALCLNPTAHNPGRHPYECERLLRVA